MNVRPGDLAVIVRSDFFPENIGTFVEVIEPFAIVDGEQDWLCKPCSPLRAQLWVGQLACAELTTTEPLDIPDAWLRPIRADGISADEIAALYLPNIPVKESA